MGWGWEPYPRPNASGPLGLGPAPEVGSKITKVKPNGVVKSGFGVSQTQVQIPAFSLAGCLTLGKARPFPGPREAHILED